MSMDKKVYALSYVPFGTTYGMYLFLESFVFIYLFMDNHVRYVGHTRFHDVDALKKKTMAIIDRNATSTVNWRNKMHKCSREK